MELELICKRRPLGQDRYAWEPFEENPEFTFHWWHRTIHHDKTTEYIEVRSADTEVARLEIDHEVHVDHYADVPDLPQPFLEIAFIEVAKGYRLQSIGTEVVHLLSEMYPTRRLVAFSEVADHFWESLLWTRYVFPEDPAFYRPLYIQARD